MPIRGIRFRLRSPVFSASAAARFDSVLHYASPLRQCSRHSRASAFGIFPIPGASGYGSVLLSYLILCFFILFISGIHIRFSLLSGFH